MLWKDVNIKSIQAATQEFIDIFKAAPKKIRLLSCARKLYTDLRNFQDSLQLIAYLKDDALRDRLSLIIISFFNVTLLSQMMTIFPTGTGGS